jgi:hypothetical protein
VQQHSFVLYLFICSFHSEEHQLFPFLSIHPSHAMSTSENRDLKPSDEPAPGLRLSDFKKVSDNGFGDGNNAYAHTMAWFKGRLYVGTTRANLCLIKNSVNIEIDRWPVECPNPVYSRDFEYQQARAEIWRYTPEHSLWERVYQAPIVTGQHGKEMSRELGYRGIVVYQAPSDPNPCLYLTNWSRSHGDGPIILRSEDGDSFEAVPNSINTIQPVNSVRSLTQFKGMLFTAPTGAGKGNPNTSGVPTIYVTTDPNNTPWQPANKAGFSVSGNATIFEMATFDDWLYAGTLNNEGFQLWRTQALGKPPFNWELVVERGAGRGALNQGVVSLQVFKGALYLGTGIQNGGYDHTNDIGPAGAEIIRVNSDSSWDLIVGDARTLDDKRIEPLSGLRSGFGNLFNGYIWRMRSHDGWLYASTMEWSMTLAYADLDKRPPKVRQVLGEVGQEAVVKHQGGFDLWRTADGENWLPVDRRGFDNPYNYGLRTMTSTPRGLFIGTANPFGPRALVRKGDDWEYADNPQGGCEIWLGNR